MDTRLVVRPARFDDDLPTFVEFRLAMFRDMGWTDEARLAELAPAYAAYLRDHDDVGDFVGWIAEVDSSPAGVVGLLWERVPPTVRNLSGRQAYVLGLYVAPPHRRQGIARTLIGTAVEHAREFGADVVSLHYSPAGQGLYRALGFKDSPEMRLFTEPASAAWSPRVPADNAD